MHRNNLPQRARALGGKVGTVRDLYARIILLLIRPALELDKPLYVVNVATAEEVREREALQPAGRRHVQW